MTPHALVWFRKDLRLTANPALNAALERGLPVICLYLLEEDVAGLRPLGGASKWWLDKSLRALALDIRGAGGDLYLKRCHTEHPAKVLQDISEQFNVKAVYWNRRYSKAERDVDTSVKSSLQAQGIEVSSFNGTLLQEPWTIQKADGSAYKVFTPFWKALSAAYARSHPYKRASGQFAAHTGERLEGWGLHPTPDWSTGFSPVWTPGEAGAKQRLGDFLDRHVLGYEENRNRPDKPSTSGLSPYLAFGEISTQDIWSITMARMQENSAIEKDGWAFLREIGWRDFSYNQVFQSRDLSQDNWNSKFNTFPWADNDDLLTNWHKGLTGYPIVDAGMRELWHTGWMHNRVRMIVASFLIKHLRTDWRKGEAWFWDTLVDADTANNPASWQWVAGSGADAAPYFRIFNPITQGEKFDPDGLYIRKWVPELKPVSLKHVHKPWEAIRPPKDYPAPMVDHKTARQAALDAFQSLKDNFG